MDHHAGVGAHHTVPKKPKQIVLRISAKNLRIIVGVLVLVALGYYGRGLFVVADVNGSFISRFAMIRELESVSGKQTLDALIAEKLIRAEAEKKGVTVTEEELNSEVAKIEADLKTQQGGTLDDALAFRGITLATLKRQITVQKLLEKLVAGDVTVTDAEADQLLKDNKVIVPAGKEAEYHTSAKNQLHDQKLNSAKSALVKNLRSSAKISMFTEYP